MLHCCFTTTLLALLQAEWLRNDSSYSSPALLLLYCACFTTAALLLLILLQAECVHVMPAQQLYCCVTSSCVGVPLYMRPHTTTYALTQLHVSLYHDKRPLYVCMCPHTSGVPKEIRISPPSRVALKSVR